jgi:NodT family efflux transporter outer membrane factor (OMF) lipoprotein
MSRLRVFHRHISAMAAHARHAGHAALAALPVLLLLSACARLGPPPASTPPAPRPAQQAGLDERGSTPRPDAQWWRDFADPALDALVARALAEQPTLAMAAARVQRAGAALAAREAERGPRLAAQADIGTQRYSEHALVPPAVAGTVRDSTTVQLAGSWEVDFFGRHRAALASALGAQRALEAEQQSARALVAAQVVRAWVQLAALAEQRRLTERQLALRTSMLELTRQRQAAGLDSRIDVRQAEVPLPELRRQLEVLDEQAVLARNQLAALSAQPPQALATLQPQLAPLRMAAAPAHLGVDLLGRRAEIVAARHRVEAAAQDIELARAQFMPDLNLMAFAGFSSLGLNRLVDFGSRTFGAGAALRLPIFDNGRLHANLDARHADLAGAVAAYDAAVIDAVRDAADAAASVQSLQRQQAEQAQTVAAAEGAWVHATERQRAGIGGSLPVLALELQWLQQRRTEADLRARQLDAQAQLMRALGGGYQETGAAR